MSGLTDGIAELFGEVFGAVYDPGSLHLITSLEDAKGKEVRTQETFPMRYQEQAVTDAMRAAPGYTAQDVRLFILTRDDNGQAIPQPRNQDEVTLASGRWRLDLITTDPARSHYSARAHPVQLAAPAEVPGGWQTGTGPTWFAPLLDQADAPGVRQIVLPRDGLTADQVQFTINGLHQVEGFAIAGTVLTWTAEDAGDLAVVRGW